MYDVSPGSAPRSGTPSPATPGTSRSLDRGLQVLLCFSEEKREWAVRDLAAQLTIPLASAHRVVASLRDAGFLERTKEGHRYRLGLRCLRLASLVLDGLDLREVAGPIMRRLVDLTGETAVLLVPHRTDAVCILQVEGRSPIRPRSVRIGDRVPYNAGAAPLAIFAFLAREEQERIVHDGLRALTDLTIVDPKALQDRCADIVQKGVAYSRGEAILGTAAVAAPIFDAAEYHVAASVGLTGIEAKIVDMEEAVMRAASEISRQLGAHGTP